MTGRYFSEPCVQLSDSIPAFWSSIRLFSGQVSDELNGTIIFGIHKACIASKTV